MSLRRHPPPLRHKLLKYARLRNEESGATLGIPLQHSVLAARQRHQLVITINVDKSCQAGAGTSWALKGILTTNNIGHVRRRRHILPKSVRHNLVIYVRVLHAVRGDLTPNNNTNKQRTTAKTRLHYTGGCHAQFMET